MLPPALDHGPRIYIDHNYIHIFTRVLGLASKNQTKSHEEYKWYIRLGRPSDEVLSKDKILPLTGGLQDTTCSEEPAISLAIVNELL